MKKISVLLSVYNNQEDIPNAIKSVIDQTYKNWELIIIDDCSTDKTLEIIEDIILQNSQYCIILIKNKKNIGVYSSLNRGLKIATGDYIARIDSDDTYFPMFLEKNIEILDNNDKYIMVNSMYKRDMDNPCFGEITCVYRRQTVIDKIGYYDSVRFAGDTEFDYRFKKVFGNHSIYKINEVLYYAKKRNNSLTTSDKTGIISAASIRTTYVKNANKWHTTTNKLYMPFPLIKRPFQIHKIMMP